MSKLTRVFHMVGHLASLTCSATRTWVSLTGCWQLHGFAAKPRVSMNSCVDKCNGFKVGQWSQPIQRQTNLHRALPLISVLPKGLWSFSSPVMIKCSRSRVPISCRSYFLNEHSEPTPKTSQPLISPSDTPGTPDTCTGSPVTLSNRFAWTETVAFMAPSEVLGVAACEISKPSRCIVFGCRHRLWARALHLANWTLTPATAVKTNMTPSTNSAVHYLSPVRTKLLFRNIVIYWRKISYNQPRAFSFYPVVCYNSRDPSVAPRYVVFQSLGASTSSGSWQKQNN